LYHKDEQVVTKFTSQTEIFGSKQFEETQLFATINSLAIFTGAINLELRKNSLRLL